MDSASFEMAAKNEWLLPLYKHIKNGADLTTIDQRTRDLLLIASCWSCGKPDHRKKQVTPDQAFELVACLLDANANINAIGEFELQISPLEIAMMRNVPKLFHYLIQKGAEVRHINGANQSMVVNAIYWEKYQYLPYLTEDLEEIRGIWAWCAISIKLEHCSRKNFPLIFEALKFLIEHGADTNRPTLHKNSMLITLPKRYHEALEQNTEAPISPEIVMALTKYLLEHKTDPNYWDGSKKSVFDYAQKHLPEVYSILLSYGKHLPAPPAQEEIKIQKRWMLAHHLKELTSVDGISRLIKEKDFFSAGVVLAKAIEQEAIDIVQAGLNTGFPPNFYVEIGCDQWGNSKEALLIYLAVKHRRFEIAKILIDRGANPFLTVEERAHNALGAILSGSNGKPDKEFALYLLNLSLDPIKDWEINVEKYPNSGGPELSNVLWDLDLTKRFIESGVSPNQIWHYTCGPIHNSLSDPEMIEYLISQGSDIEDVDYENSDITTFGAAIGCAYLESMDVIYRHKPKIHPQTLYAVFNNEEEADQLKVLKKLYELGVDLKQFDDLLMLEAILHVYYRSAAGSACRDYLFSLFGTDTKIWHIRCWCALGDLDKVRELFNPNDPQNGHLLSIAIFKNYADIVKFLLENWVSANGYGKMYNCHEEMDENDRIYYNRHLYRAIEFNYIELVQLLLNYGAIPDDHEIFGPDISKKH